MAKSLVDIWQRSENLMKRLDKILFFKPDCDRRQQCVEAIALALWRVEHDVRPKGNG